MAARRRPTNSPRDPSSESPGHRSPARGIVRAQLFEQATVHAALAYRSRKSEKTTGATAPSSSCEYKLPQIYSSGKPGTEALARNDSVPPLPSVRFCDYLATTAGQSRPGTPYSAGRWGSAARPNCNVVKNRFLGHPRPTAEEWRAMTLPDRPVFRRPAIYPLLFRQRDLHCLLLREQGACLCPKACSRPRRMDGWLSWLRSCRRAF